MSGMVFDHITNDPWLPRRLHPAGGISDLSKAYIADLFIAGKLQPAGVKLHKKIITAEGI